MKLNSYIILSLFVCWTTSSRAADAPTPTIRRFALVAGVNQGGVNRTTLKFATRDAETFAQVMEDLGGVSPEDRLLLLNPRKADLLQGLSDLIAKMAATRNSASRTEAIFYYSGHSDETGLLLQGDLLGYQELRDAMHKMPAEVRIAVVDSCSSGALTRAKGGKRRAPFLLDASTQLQGHAFLTSSSANEVAQESDRIGASFFTHFLVSGLRGAADMSGDGRVTLTEAYQFAFNETLAKTENSRAGAQHANYDIDLSGSGDLVMTDLRTTSAALVLSEDISGRLFIRDDKGQLAVELFKTRDRLVELGISPGDYSVMLDDRGKLSRAQIELTQSGKFVLQREQFEKVEGEYYTTRGNTFYDPADYDVEYASFSLLPTFSSSGGRKTLKHFSFNLIAGYGDRLEGVEISPAINVTGESVTGVQLAAGVNLDWGNLNGIQIGAGANLARQGGIGTQLTGGVNVIGSDFLGMQASGGVNASFLGRFQGVQVTGGVNIVKDHMDGVQIAGGANSAASLRGAQIGVINISGDVTGLQLGVVNVAIGDVQGTQVGVVNYAGGYLSGIPVGLLNVVKNADYHPEVWGSDTSPLNIGLRMNLTPHYYAVFSLGYSPGADDRYVSVMGRGRSRASYGIGFGGMYGLTDQLRLHGDVVCNSVLVGTRTGTFQGEDNDLLPQVRLSAHWQFFDHLGIFAGTSLNTYMSWNKEQKVAEHLSGDLPHSEVNDGAFSARFWPGFFAGVAL